MGGVYKWDFTVCLQQPKYYEINSFFCFRSSLRFNLYNMWQNKEKSERDLRSCEVTWAVTNKAQKKFWGSNGIRTHDLRDTGTHSRCSAVTYQLQLHISENRNYSNKNKNNKNKNKIKNKINKNNVIIYASNSNSSSSVRNRFTASKRLPLPSSLD